MFIIAEGSAFEFLNPLCLAVTGQGGSVGCKMSRGSVCPAAGTGRCLRNLRVSRVEAAPYPMEDGGVRSFIVQVHVTAEKCSPQQGWEDHFLTGQGLFHGKQLCFIFASVNHCSSGFMLVSECN